MDRRLLAAPDPRPSALQGKTVIQAEIDAAAELIDFFRFNAKYAVELEGQQPISVPPSTNSMVYRGLEVPAGGIGRAGGAAQCHGPDLTAASFPRASWRPSRPLTSLQSAATWRGHRP